MAEKATPKLNTEEARRFLLKERREQEILAGQEFEAFLAEMRETRGCVLSIRPVFTEDGRVGTEVGIRSA